MKRVLICLCIVFLVCASMVSAGLFAKNRITANVISQGWTDWLNRDSPTGTGDFETLADFLKEGADVCEHPVGIECQTIEGMDAFETGEEITCDFNTGLVCKNSLQSDEYCDYDYKVRFYCGDATQTCIDSDGGLNYDVRGNASLGKHAITDHCDANTLHEAICTDGQIDTFQYDCPISCLNGVCSDVSSTPAPNCTDTDTGIIFGTFGNATNLTDSFTDVCNGVALTEYYCNESGVISSVEQVCAGYCVDNTCTNYPYHYNVSTCTDSDGGDKPFIFGYKLIPSLGTLDDQCMNNYTLLESVCNSDLGVRHYCENGCSGGVCLGDSTPSSSGVWTDWFDRDNPSGTGDFETLADFLKAGYNTCENPTEIECQTTTGIDASETGEVITCSPDVGFVCAKSLQSDGKCDYDYKVRFLCDLCGSNFCLEAPSSSFQATNDSESIAYSYSTEKDLDELEKEYSEEGYSSQDQDIEEEETKLYCVGCSLYDQCFEFGSRTLKKYCSEEGIFSDFKNKGDSCEEHYECKSKLCLSSICIEQGVADKASSWFNEFFR